MMDSFGVKRTTFAGIALMLGLLLSCAIATSAKGKRAFLVGISEYPADGEEDCWEAIHGRNDLEILTPTLKKHGFKVETLTDADATAANIRRNLGRFSSSLSPGDIVYLHFSCHGQPVEDRDGDEEDGWDEALVAVDARKNYVKGKYQGDSHITDDELNAVFSSIRSRIGSGGFLTVVVDACHAGTAYRGDEEEDSVIVRGTNDGFSERGLKFVPKIDKRGRLRVDRQPGMAGVCVIEACRSYQLNKEIRFQGEYYGSLSFYTNRVLQAKGTVDWRSRWYEEVVALMGKDSRLFRQNPVIETSGQ